MGSLALPANDPIYLDTNCFIYTVERIEPYRVSLDAIWDDVRARHLLVLTSELTTMETLVKPLRAADAPLEALYRTILHHSPDVRSVPVSRSILERAAALRATTNLKTPDAIHAATALEHSCAFVLTNDPAFRRVPGLSVALLDDLLTP